MKCDKHVLNRSVGCGFTIILDGHFNYSCGRVADTNSPPVVQRVSELKP